MSKTIKLDMHRIARLVPGYDAFATAPEGHWFDGDAAQRAVAFIEECVQHIEGELAGQPFILQDWQKAIVANLFGWKRKDARGRTVRRYRTALLFVARKNGKTPLAAAIALYWLFCEEERGQQNYIAASTKEQAGLLFRQCRGMIEQEQELASRCQIFGGHAAAGQSQSIVRQSTGSFLKIVAGDATLGKHGKNLNLAIVDELHEQPSRDLVDTFTSSMVSANKPQPLLLYLTTSDYEREGSICNEIHEYAGKVRDGIIDDPSFLPVIYEANNKEDDWTKEATWVKANPNIDVSVSREFLATECRKAQEQPAYENVFKRLHLNIRTEQAVRLIPMDQWDACGEPFDPSILDGRACYAGLDLATVEDLAACVLVFPPLSDAEPYYALSYFWCPQDTAQKRSRKTRIPYLQWAREGHIELTGGNSIDYRYIRQRLNELGKRFDIQEVPFDPWNATHLATELGEEDGFVMVPFRQGMVSLNEPTKFLLRILLDNQLRHGGNPVLRWMASNAAAETDSAGNLKPSKKCSGEKIDGIIALIMGLGRAMVQPEATSFFDARGEILTV
jgi:phage terminase large subunit-like protein